MKQKILFRALALLILLASLLCVTSCGATSQTPEGMQLATAYGAKYRLYIPTTWSVTLQPGVSGGYYNLLRQSTVSVAEYPIDAELEATMTEKANADDSFSRVRYYFDTAVFPQVELIVSGDITTHQSDCIATLLGDANARQFHYSANVSGKVLHFLQVIAEKDGSFYVFSYTAEEEIYEMCLPDVQKMLKEFYFAPAHLPVDPVKDIPVDENTPEGMKLASNKDVAYLFYVPADWTVNVTEKIFSARAKDGSSVSVIPYQPSAEGVTITDYFKQSEDMMKSTSGNAYERISEKAGTLGGGNALVYEYKYTVAGTTYQYLQVIVGYKGMIYNLTYTALPQNFEANRADVNAIIDAFTFR